MRLFTKSIIRKIFLIAGSLILLIFVVYASFFNWKIKQYFEQSSKDALLKDAKQISTEIHLFMNTYQVIVEQMQKNNDFATVAARIPDKKTKKADPLYYSVNQQLLQIKQSDPNIALAYIGNLKANDLITDIYDYSTPNDFDLAQRPWYKQTIQNSRATVSSPYVDVVTKKMVVSLSIPLFKDNLKVGAVAIDIMLDDIYKIMTNYKIGESGYALLLRKDGSIIYHPNFPNNAELSNANISNLIEKSAAKILAGGTGLIEYNYNNEDKYLAYVPIDNSDLIVATIIPRSQVFAPLKSFIATNIFVLILVLLLIATLLTYLENIITKPLVKICFELETFNKNNLVLDLPDKLLTRQDEIGTLARSLRFMSEKISNHVLEIDERNLALSEEITIRSMMQVRLEMILKLLSGTREGIFILDENYVCLYKNNAFEELDLAERYDLDKINILNKLFTQKSSLLNDLIKGGQVITELSIKNIKNISLCLFIKIYKINYKDKNYYIGSTMDLTASKQSEQALYLLKYFDSLTNLKNKKYFEDFAEKLLLANTAPNLMNALIIVNLDDFRLTNEAKGFEFGNKILIALGEKLKSFEAENDILARLGNDEFCLLKTGFQNNEDLYKFVVSMEKKLNSAYIIDNEEIFINSRLGIGVYPQDAKSADKLLKAATSALNNIKTTKEGNFEFYNTDINNQSVYKYELQNKLRTALTNKEFFLCYQPQINIYENKIIGLESLIRWQPADSNAVIPPNLFIPLVEKSNLIIPIGEWVLTTACEFAIKLLEKGYEIPVAVNISRLQFKNPYIISLITSVLETTKLPAHLLEIEITEGILMDNHQECELIIDELKSMGVKIAIDDFGTGYSSLSYLKRFAVDKIKIDRSFIKDIPEQDSGVIAKVIIDLATNLKMNVIAEGIETDAQLAFLKNNNCPEAQGFMFAKPLKEVEALNYIENFK